MRLAACKGLAFWVALFVKFVIGKFFDGSDLNGFRFATYSRIRSKKFSCFSRVPRLRKIVPLNNCFLSGRGLCGGFFEDAAFCASAFCWSAVRAG